MVTVYPFLWPEYTLVIDLVNEGFNVRDELKNFITSLKIPFIIGSVIYREPRPWHEDVGLIFDKHGRLLDYYSSVAPALFNMYTLKNNKPSRVFEAPFYKNELTRQYDKFGMIVCWEEINSNLAREYTRRGAKYLISLSNDQDLNHSWLLRLTSYYTRARAAENKRYLVRVTNSGVTQIISPLGKVIAKIPAQKAGFLSGTIYTIPDLTFYAKHGDTLVKIVFLMLALTMLLVKKNRKNR